MNVWWCVNVFKCMPSKHRIYLVDVLYWRLILLLVNYVGKAFVSLIGLENVSEERNEYAFCKRLNKTSGIKYAIECNGIKQQIVLSRRYRKRKIVQPFCCRAVYTPVLLSFIFVLLTFSDFFTIIMPHYDLKTFQVGLDGALGNQH